MKKKIIILLLLLVAGPGIAQNKQQANIKEYNNCREWSEKSEKLIYNKESTVNQYISAFEYAKNQKCYKADNNNYKKINLILKKFAAEVIQATYQDRGLRIEVSIDSNGDLVIYHLFGSPGLIKEIIIDLKKEDEIKDLKIRGVKSPYDFLRYLGIKRILATSGREGYDAKSSYVKLQ